MNYQYPIDPDWTTDEIIIVIRFFEMIEKAYETGIKREKLLSEYNRFKEIVPSKSEEKKLCTEFEEVSGYSTYRTIKKGKESEIGTIIRMQS